MALKSEMKGMLDKMSKIVDKMKDEDQMMNRPDLDRSLNDVIGAEGFGKPNQPDESKSKVKSVLVAMLKRRR